jgi:hypothetical protein
MSVISDFSDVTSPPSSSHCRKVGNERLSPKLLKGRGKLIGGDLYIDDEGSELNVELLPSLHHKFVCYQFMN